MMDVGTWRESRFLAVILTDEELQSRGQQLADAVQKRDELEAEQKAEREEMKERMVSAEASIGHLAKIVNERKEVRPVDVECRLNVDRHEVTTVRLDSAEVIERREAVPTDAMRLQATLPGVVGDTPAETQPGA